MLQKNAVGNKIEVAVLERSNLGNFNNSGFNLNP